MKCTVKENARYCLMAFFVFVFFFFGCKTVPESESENESYEFTYADYKIQPASYKIPGDGKDNFTIAVLPDIQNYTRKKSQKDKNKKCSMNNYTLLYDQVDYVAKNTIAQGGPIVFAVFLGDMVQCLGRTTCEWVYANNAVKKLDSLIPYSVIIGNHDYDKKVEDKEQNKDFLVGTKKFEKYFGPKSKHFAGKEWYKGHSPDNLASCIVFNAGEKQILYIGLSFEPSDEELKWGQEQINKYHDIPVIVATHGYLDSRGNFIGLVNHNPVEGNSAQDVYEKFIYPNKNIFLVLCGHAFNGIKGEARRADKNIAGYTVYSLLSNYQERMDYYRVAGFSGSPEKSGDGFFRLMNFDVKKKKIYVQTYSTAFDCFETDEDSEFVLDISDFSKRFGW